MKEIIAFLRELQQHNDRTWFQAHKEQFADVQARFHVIVDELIKGIAQFDPAISGLNAKECTYRIP